MAINVSKIEKSIQRFLSHQKRIKNLKYNTCPIKQASIEDTLNLSSRQYTKANVIPEYCAKNNYNLDLTLKEFEIAEKYLDAESIQRLLKLTQEDKIHLMDKPTITLRHKACYFADLYRPDKVSIISRLKTIQNTYNLKNIEVEESAKTLKSLLKFEAEGKIPAETIGHTMKVQELVDPVEFQKLIKAIEEGKINNKNISHAINMTENYMPISLLYKNSIEELSNNELKELSNILASKSSNRGRASEQTFKDSICEIDTPLLPKNKNSRSKLLDDISKKLTKLVKINTVKEEAIVNFNKNFDNMTKIFAESKHSIDDLSKSGGIQLSYPRETFKINLLKHLKNLPKEEQANILEKFGLEEAEQGILKGLPVHINSPKGDIEIAINKEIDKFLNNNKIILPKGFEEYQQPIEDICKAFPEFTYTIGSIQHNAHSKDLSQHILMAFQENVKNPLYKDLNSSDKKILGISTILHDINKTEHIIDKEHPLISSNSAAAIVNRMDDLSVTEKNRIINFIENHHWLIKIQDNSNLDETVIKDLAMKYRSGNDFEMAKIFAESDLKAVNASFFPLYGKKINSPMTKAIEEEILKIQTNGRAIYTADITAKKALQMGGRERILGEGNEITHNIVVSAKQVGLDHENVIYHAPGKDDGFILAKTGFGPRNEGVLSVSYGRNGHSATFQRRKEFFGFRQPDMNKISVTLESNGNLGVNKGYNQEKRWLMQENSFSKYVKKEYTEQMEKPLTDKDYALIFREIQSLKTPDMIHSNKKVQNILGGEKEAKTFENIIIKNNEKLISTQKDLPSSEWRFSELVASDLEVGFIGTNRKPEEVPYAVRKLAEENNWPIIPFD